jgi:N-acetylneuraminate synthase
MKAIEISDKTFGTGAPCFIIAEAGVNHNGDLQLAKRLIDAARNAGANAVKFQTWITDKLVAPDARMAEYQQKNVGGEQTQYEMLKQLELSFESFRELKDYAGQQNILFFSTPDEEESADFLDTLGVEIFKVGSGEVTNLPFLRHIALKGKPIILSTGMSTLGEVETAVRKIEETGNQQLVLLHCVSNYPADPADCNLQAMQTLRQAFGYPVGFSDHTLGIEVPIAAVALGACVIEKHLTLDKTMPGPDHRGSLDASEFSAMVKAIRTIESALGNGRKLPRLSELDTKKVVQKAIVVTRALQAGDRVEESDLALRRTSGGLSSEYLAMLIGKQLICNIEENAVITLDMVQ